MKRIVWLAALSTTLAWLAGASAKPSPGPSSSASAEPAPSAPDTPPPSEAGRIYLEAQEHFKARRYTEALPLFQRLSAEQRSPNARLYVARCLREMARLPAAYDEMALTVGEATARAQSEPRFATTRDAAQTELDQLRVRVALLDIRPSAWPDRLRVEVNGRAIARQRLSAPIPVMPGSVRFVATAPGYETVRSELLINPNVTQLVPLVLRAAGSAPAAAPSTGPVPTASPAGKPVVDGSRGDEDATDDDGEAGTSGYVTGGITFVGLGVVGWIVFAVAGTMADDRFEEIVDECNGFRCADQSMNDKIDEGRVMDIVANAGLGLGVISTVTAGILFAIAAASGGDDDAPAGAPAPVVSPRAWTTPSGSFVGVAGTF